MPHYIEMTKIEVYLQHPIEMTKIEVILPHYIEMTKDKRNLTTLY